jgi:hypothetical protein
MFLRDAVVVDVVVLVVVLLVLVVATRGGDKAKTHPITIRIDLVRKVRFRLNLLVVVALLRRTKVAAEY